MTQENRKSNGLSMFHMYIYHINVYSEENAELLPRWVQTV